MKKLLQTEEKLGFAIPTYLFDFISNLKIPEVQFGQEEWLFWTVTDDPADPDDNFIITHSVNFQELWGKTGLVFATNGIGDYLVMLRDEEDKEFLPQVFVMMHETAEVKVFAANWDALLTQGPGDYFWNDEFYFKLDDNNKLITWGESADSTTATGNDKDDQDFFGDDYTLRSKLDDLIDDERTELTSEIIQGLERLAGSDEASHRTWALNKLSDIYFKGFGPVPPDMTKALNYNQLAIDLDSHLAYSNRAACYFFGLGLNKDLDKALALATKANDLSKSNMFADIFATRDGGGMYDNLVDMISQEIRKQKG